MEGEDGVARLPIPCGANSAGVARAQIPQPTIPTLVMMVQYCPFSQRLLMPIPTPLSNCMALVMDLGKVSLM